MLREIKIGMRTTMAGIVTTRFERHIDCVQKQIKLLQKSPAQVPMENCVNELTISARITVPKTPRLLCKKGVMN